MENRTLSSKKAFFVSFILNVAFLVFILMCFTPYFNTNDDLLLMHLVDGSYGFHEFRLIYINVILGFILRFLYLIFPSLPCYSIFQYFCLFSSFTAICFVLIRRWKPVPALVCFASFLFFFGLDSYIVIQYTKTASVLTLAGMMLMFYALENKSAGKKQALLVLGALISLIGMMYRYMQFLACGAIAGCIIFDFFLKHSKACSIRKEFFSECFKSLRPFILLLAVAVTLILFDKSFYRSSEWREYIQYNEARTAIMDYGKLSDYEDAPQIYEEIGISPSFLELIKIWDFQDTDIVDTETFKELLPLINIEWKQSSKGILVSYLEYLDHFFNLWPARPLLAIAFIWLLFGRHDKNSLLSLGFSILVSLLLTLYMFTKGRYNIYHVEYGLLLAVSIVFLWLLPCQNGKNAQAALAAFLITCLMLVVYLPRWSGKFTKADSINSSKCEQLISTLKQTDGLIISNTCIFSSELYLYETPFSTDHILATKSLVSFGGWHGAHPLVLDVLEEYGVNNPYKDCVNNDRVFVLSNQIDLVLSHIRREHYPNAYYELLLPPEDGLGYGLYKILS